MLTDAELEQLLVDGYVVKPGLLDPQLCALARNKLWGLNDLPRLIRDDPSSFGPFSAGEEMPRTEGRLLDKQLEIARPQMSRRGYGFWMSAFDTQRDPDLLDLLPRNPQVQAIAAQLLGADRLVSAVGGEPEMAPGDPDGAEPFQTGQATRGIYCTLPRTGAAAETDQPCEAGARGGPPRGGHWDNVFDPAGASTVCLLASAYIDDVPKSGGGFVLWPGSHRRNWRYHSEHHSAGLPRPEGRRAPNGDGIEDLPNHIMADSPPVECYGPAGTVVFWHAMVLHAAGINKVPGHIRQSVIYDFKLTEAARAELAATAREPAQPVPLSCGPEDEAATLWAGWNVPETVVELLGSRPPPGTVLLPGHAPVLHPHWEQQRDAEGGARL